MSERAASDTETPARTVTEVYFIDPVTKLPVGPGVSSLTYDISAEQATEGVRGGSYIWAATATAWGGATVTLQALGPDGTTWLSVDSLTANGAKGVVVGEGATLQLAISGGAPTALATSLS